MKLVADPWTVDADASAEPSGNANDFGFGHSGVERVPKLRVPYRTGAPVYHRQYRRDQEREPNGCNPPTPDGHKGIRCGIGVQRLPSVKWTSSTEQTIRFPGLRSANPFGRTTMYVRL